MIHISTMLISQSRVIKVAKLNRIIATIHTTSQQKSSGETTILEPVEKKTVASGLAKRFAITGEVTVSKIFPAGFGWQSSSIVAENYLGYAPDTAAFALTTGAGDGIGVLLGHCMFYGAKKAITGNEKIIMKREVENGVLLASAAFCSGSLWQPLVDILQGANLPFSGVFCGTWIGKFWRFSLLLLLLRA